MRVPGPTGPLPRDWRERRGDLRVVAALMVAVVACSPRTEEEALVVSGSPPLSGAELRALLPGSTARGLGLEPRVFFTIVFGPDGALTGRIGASPDEVRRATEYPSVDAGAWRITEAGTVCIRWHRWLEGTESCQRVHRSGRKFQAYLRNGRLALTFRLER